MANRTYTGGSPTVTQIVDVTPANVEIGDIFTITFSSEPDSTGSVSTADVSFTATAATVANVTAGLAAAVAASTEELVEDVIAAVDNTTKVTLTNTEAGIPFYVTTSTTNGGGADTQTLTPVVVQTNGGPEDYNDTGNWLEGAIPVDGDDVRANQGAYSMKYGLLQNTVTPGSFRTGPQWEGNVGDPETASYLTYDVTSATTKGQFDSRGQATLIRGGFASFNVKGTVNAEEAVKVGGLITDMRVMGGNVGGGIVLLSQSAVVRIRAVDCPRAQLDIEGKVLSLQTIEGVNCGTITNKSAVVGVNAKVTLDVGTYVHFDDDDGTATAVLNADVRHGIFDYRGSGRLGDSGGGEVGVRVYSGLLTLLNSEAPSLVIDDYEQWGGNFEGQNSLVNVTFTNDPIVHDGNANLPEGATQAAAA